MEAQYILSRLRMFRQYRRKDRDSQLQRQTSMLLVYGVRARSKWITTIRGGGLRAASSFGAWGGVHRWAWWWLRGLLIVFMVCCSTYHRFCPILLSFVDFALTFMDSESLGALLMCSNVMVAVWSHSPSETVSAESNTCAASSSPSSFREHSHHQQHYQQYRPNLFHNNINHWSITGFKVLPTALWLFKKGFQHIPASDPSMVFICLIWSCFRDVLLLKLYYKWQNNTLLSKQWSTPILRWSTSWVVMKTPATRFITSPPKLSPTDRIPCIPKGVITRTIKFK